MSGLFRAVTTLFCAITLVIASLPVTGVVIAQSSIVGEATGVTVTLGPDWALAHQASNSDATQDYLAFVNGNANIAVSSSAINPPDVSAGLSLIPGDASITDIDVSGSYALYSVDANGGSYGVFSVVVGSDVQTVMAPTSGFANAIASAQTDIQINGAAMFNGVDGQALAPAITLGTADAAADASLPPLIPMAEPVADSADSEADAEEAATAETTTADVAEEASPDPVDSAGSGFIDEYTWVSPLHGTRVAWVDSWEPRTRDESGNPTFFTMDGADILCLTTTDTADEAVFCISVRPHSEFIGDQETWNSRFLSPESKGTYGLPRFGVVVTAEGFSYGDTSLDLQEARLTQGVVGDGIYAEMSIRAPLDQLPSLLAPAQAAITVDDNPAFHLQDVTTFTSESEALAASVPGLVEERDARLEAMGLIDANHYASVATGCDISWDDPLVLNTETSMEPIFIAPAWMMDTGEESLSESFYLGMSETTVGMNITCYADSGAWGGDVWWADAGYLVIEGDGIRYGISPDMDGSHEVYVVISSPDSPGLVEVTFYQSQEELVALIDAGGFVVNGVDVFQDMEDSDLVGQLP